MSIPAPPDQEVRFCRSADGVRLAYAVTGDGPPVVKTATWLSHLEVDWRSPVWRHLLDELSRGRRLVRYDHRGTGLSDHDVEDLTLDAFVADLESVVDAAGLERFALLGISQACAVSIAYSVRHPERVSRLVLSGGYARGWKVRQSEESRRRDEAVATLLHEGWGREHASFRRMFVSLFMPDAIDEQMDWFTELQRATASPENAVRIRDAMGLIDVTELLPRVAAPTLVFHCRDDVVVPFSQGKAVAAGIEGARFVPLESRNHLVLEHDPAWKVLSREMREFLDEGSAESETPTLQWSRVDALLDKALDVPAAERAAFVRDGAGGDGALEAEVLRLLELAEGDDDLLAPSGARFGGVWDDALQEIEREGQAETFQIGDRVGSYEILRRLGTGGMGQVYAAVDERLDREVALKVLPPRLRTEDYRKRFEREAKAIAALNHPNIVHLYSYEESDGVHFITMELVKGRSLSELVPEKGLPLELFFEIAIDVVDALVAAHDRGIIHRDLKPANVIVNEDGRAKILDFGVAKQKGSGSGPLGLEDEIDESATAKGIIVGTVSHMSPEQAEGKELDARTDLFSLGVCLYEMCTGSRPFTGDSAAAVLATILAFMPPAVDEVNPKLPHELGRIIKRCLAKDRSRRYQSALDVKNDLEALRFELDSRALFSPSFRAGQSHGRRLGLVAATIAAVLGAVALVWTGVASREERVDTPPTGTFEQVTSRQGQETSPSLSPDGRFLVYAGRLGTDWDVFLLRVDGGQPINLTEESESDDTQPVLSPDGARIAFRSARDGGGIFVMGATGEFVRRVTDFGWNPAWSPDGQRLVFATEAISRTPLDRPSTSALWIVDLDSGATRQLLESDGVQPSWSPGGERIAYWALSDPGGQRDLWTVPVEGGAPRRVTEDVAVDWNPVWSPDGRYLYFSSDRGGSINLWRIAVDERTGEARGEPEAVTAPSTFAANVSLSADGKLLAYSSTNHSIDLGWIDIDPDALSVVPGSAATNREVRETGSPDPSPDGEWIAFTREGVQEDIVLVRPEGGEIRPLTDDPHRDRFPRWSPDGERIAFYSNRGGSYEIWAIDADGGGLAPLTFVGSNVHSPVWSPDGARIAWARGGGVGGFVDVTVPWSEEKVHLFPGLSEGREDDRFTPMDWSPDGRSILGYAQTPTGMRVGIIVYSIEDGTYDYVTDFGAYPRWLKDDRVIVFQGQSPERSEAHHDFQQDAKLFVVDRRTKRPRELFAVPGSSLETPAVTRDRRRIYFARNTVEADIWILRFP